MKSFLIRSAIIILVILFQISFLNLVFSNSRYSLSIIPLVVIAWVIASGFEKVWGWILILGILAGIINMENFWSGILFIMLLAYSVSFLSKRFLIERRLYGFITIVLFIAITTLFKKIISLLSFSGLKQNIVFSYFKDNPFLWRNLLVEIFIAVLFFYIIYIFLGKVENYIKKCEDRLRIRY